MWRFRCNICFAVRIYILYSCTLFFIFCFVFFFMCFFCYYLLCCCCFFFSSRRRHTRCLSDWSSDVCSSDLEVEPLTPRQHGTELFEEPRHGWEEQFEMRERHLGRLGDERLQQRGQRGGVLLRQIGRASCRERVEVSGVGVSVTKQTERHSRT